MYNQKKGRIILKAKIKFPEDREFVLKGDKLIKYNGKSAVVNIPGTVREIGTNAFCHNIHIRKVIIPDSAEKIDKCAFNDCRFLKEIRLPDSNIIIEIAAFRNCPGLTAILNELMYYNAARGIVTILDGTERIDDFRFYFNEVVNEVILPDSVREIGEFAFSDCTNLKKINLPKGLTAIGAYAFNNCTNLKDITLPEGMTVIEAGVFRNCKALEHITIPVGVTEIDDSAFRGCIRLVAPDLPDGLKSIGGFAFSGCDNIKSMVIPESVEKIGNTALDDCTELIQLTLHEDLEPSFPYLYSIMFLSGCRKLTSIVLTGEKADILNKARSYFLGHFIHRTDEANSVILKFLNLNTVQDMKNGLLFFISDGCHPTVKNNYRNLFDELLSQPLIMEELTGNKVLSRTEAEFLLHNEQTSIECRVILMEYLLGIQ